MKTQMKPPLLGAPTAATRNGEAERFVLSAVQAFARGTPSPHPKGDWVPVAKSAGVLATVADVLATDGHELHGQARTIRVTAAATSMRVAVELRALERSLEGLRWVVLKGPVLADVVYRTRSSRTYDDLDVLVHPADLPTGLARLTASGFRLVDQNWPMIARMRRGEITLLGPTGGVLDLHWHPVNDAVTRARLPIDLGAMLRDAQRVSVAGVEVPSLGPADLVVYVALHASLSGGHFLKWLLDVQQAVLWSGLRPSEIGWRARVHGLGLITRTMLQRVVDHVDPALTPFVAAAAPASPWSALAHVVSRAKPPVSSAHGRRSGRSVFAATGHSSRTSASQLIAGLVADRRDQRRGRDAYDEISRLHTRVDSPADRARWLADASAEVR